jgi:hypothetical protein
MVGAQLAFKGLDVGARECDVSAMSQAAGIRLPDNELMIGGEMAFLNYAYLWNHVRVFFRGYCCSYYNVPLAKQQTNK